METIADFLTVAAAWTVRNSIYASILILLVLLMTRLVGRRLHLRLAIWLWIAIGVRLVQPIVPESSFSLSGMLPISSARHYSSTSFQTDGSSDRNGMDSGVLLPRSAEDSNDVIAPLPWASWLTVCGGFWGLGTIVLLSSAIWRQQITSRRLDRALHWDDPTLRSLLSDCARRAGISPRLQIVAGPLGSGVAVFGGLNATHLIVPADFFDQYSIAEQRGILQHELAHVRRHDLLWNWIAYVIQCLHWFNPLVWIAGRRFLFLREMICDRDAVRGLSASDCQGYGAALVKAIEQGRTLATSHPAFSPFFSHTSELKHRISMIIKPQSTPLSIQLTVAALAVASGLSVFTVSPTLADGERPQRESERKEAREGERERSAQRPSREAEREDERERPRRDRDREEGREMRREREDRRREETPALRSGSVEITIQEDGVSVNGEKPVPLANLRRELDSVSARSAVLQAAQGVSFHTVETVVSALKSVGIQEISFGTSQGSARRQGDEASNKNRRDGEGGPKTGPRDGEGGPKTGPRDGEGGPKTGPRDGDAPRRDIRERGDERSPESRR